MNSQLRAPQQQHQAARQEAAPAQPDTHAQSLARESASAFTCL